MISLPETGPDYKTAVVFTRGIYTLFILLRMKELYGTLDNVVPTFFPFTELTILNNNVGKISNIMQNEIENQHNIFTELCKDFDLNRKLEFKSIEDLTLNNGDNLIKEHHRLSIFDDTEKLLNEKNIYNEDITTVTTSITYTDKNELLIENYLYEYLDFYSNDNKGRIFNPIKHLRKKEVLEYFTENDQEIMKKYFDMCPTAYPVRCGKCVECEIKNEFEMSKT